MTGGELSYADIKDIKPEIGESYRDIKPDKTLSSKELNDAVNAEFSKAAKEYVAKETKVEEEKKGLSDKEKEYIKKETGWSDKIIDSIDSMEQFEIYQKADLHEAVINGKTCLAKNIDYDYVDPKTGKTNRELMEDGRSPIDPKTGEKIELHHMGQQHDAPFAELCENSEHGDGNDSILHPKSENSWRNNIELKNRYSNVEKPNHWKERSKEA